MIVLGLLAACADPMESGGSSSTTPSMPASYTGTEATELLPILSAEEVAAEVEALFSTGLPNVVDIRDTYMDLMAQGDESCPGDATQLGSQVGPHGCEAASGVRYAGISSFWDDGESWFLTADFDIWTPDGGHLGAGGHVGSLRFKEGGGWLIEHGYAGTWIFSGGEGPLGEGISGVQSLRWAGDEALEEVQLNGAVSIGAQALVFQGVRADVECWDQLAGLIQVRDVRGTWSLLELADDCSGCGEVRFGNEVLGDVCLEGVGIDEELFAALPEGT